MKAKYVIAKNTKSGGVAIFSWESNKKEALKLARQMKARVFRLVEVTE